jgi:hypothetical protein
MVAFTFFHEFKKYLGNKEVDMDSDAFKAVLSNTAPSAANNLVLADITQIANGNGYVTGGLALAGLTWAETGSGTGIWQWTVNDFTWTAAGGSIANFQYIVIYDDTHASDALVGYYDYGSVVTVTVGNAFTVDIGANGVFQLS